MRVICVDGARRKEDLGTEPLLNEGEIYIVEREVYGNTSNGKVVECYQLTSIELPHVYAKNRFVPCGGYPGDWNECSEPAEERSIAV